jgi:predicted CoA-binding protein
MVWKERCLHDTYTRTKGKVFELIIPYEKENIDPWSFRKPARYSYLALKRLNAHQNPIVAIGKKSSKVDDVEIVTDKVAVDDIDTVTLYLNPVNQKPYYDYILSLNPKRIIFNPGTENEELYALAKKRESR